MSKIVFKKKVSKNGDLLFFLLLIIKIIIYPQKNAILVLKTKKLFFGGDILLFFSMIELFTKKYHFIPKIRDSYFSTFQIFIFRWCFYTFF